MFLMAEYFFTENNENTYEQKFRNQKHDVTDRICTLSKLSKLILLLFLFFLNFGMRVLIMNTHSLITFLGLFIQYLDPAY